MTLGCRDMKLQKYALICLIPAVLARGEDTSSCITPSDYAKGLYHKQALMRHQAALQLALIGEKSLPELERALRSGQEHPMWASLEALTRIGSNSVPIYVRALSDGDIRVREMSCNGLQRLGHDAAAALPVLHKQLTNDHFSVVNHALMAITAISNDVPRIAAELERLTHHPDYSISGMASNVLTRYQTQKE